MTPKKQKIDKEEVEILEAFENGKTESVDNLKEEKLKASKFAANTKNRTKPVNIRLSTKDLDEIQKKAEKIGLPYQTLINLLIHQYNQGKIKLIL
jgi:predicted DNA binding CopG/RHH family protein